MSADTELPEMEELGCWMALSLIPGLGGETFRRLLAAFGTPPQIFATPAQRLREVVDDKMAVKIAEGVTASAQLDAGMAWLAQPGTGAFTGQALHVCGQSVLGA